MDMNDFIMGELIPYVARGYDSHKQTHNYVFDIKEEPYFEDPKSTRRTIKEELHIAADEYAADYKEELERAFFKYKMLHYFDENDEDERTIEAKETVDILQNLYDLASKAKQYINRFI